MKRSNNCRIANIWIVLILLLVVLVFGGCGTHRMISREKTEAFRDSAWKYAWGGLNWAASSKYYDSVFASGYILKKDYYYAGEVAAELGNYSKCIALWSKMLKMENDDGYDYYLPRMIGPQHSYYQELIHFKGFDELWSNFPEYDISPHLSYGDSVLARKINRMFFADQFVRTKNADSIHTKRVSRLLDSIDAAHAAIVDSIIINRGVISGKQFGYATAFNFFILFDHLPDSLLIKRMPLIEAMLKDKGIDKADYAMIKDRSLVFEKKEQLYGTQLRVDKITNKNSFYPIRNIRKVDSRRKKMKLSKLIFYAELHKAPLPKDYKP